MSADHRIIRYRGRYYVEYRTADGVRKRNSLSTDDWETAQARAAAWLRALTAPQASSTETLWRAYLEDKQGRAVTATMVHTWKALAPIFGGVRPEDISPALCRQHIAARRDRGISDGTILTELGHLQTVLNWAGRLGALDRVPHIERPAKPPPRDRYLTRDEARRLIDAAMPHVRLFVTLALATAARKQALLGLTWDRVDFEAGLIDLREQMLRRRHKGRAIVPMNRNARTALEEAKAGALSPYVIEWAGGRVHSMRKGLATAAGAARVEGVTPHVLRHTAAVWLAEAGTPMTEIAQYLGHTNSRVTEKVYARYSPDYLRGAAAALEL